MHPSATLQQLGRSTSFSSPTTGKFPSLSKWFHRVIDKDCSSPEVEQDDEIVHMVFSKEKQEDYTEKRLNKALKEWENETSLCVGMTCLPLFPHQQVLWVLLELENPTSLTLCSRPPLVKKITNEMPKMK